MMIQFSLLHLSRFDLLRGQGGLLSDRAFSGFSESVISPNRHTDLLIGSLI